MSQNLSFSELVSLATFDCFVMESEDQMMSRWNFGHQNFSLHPDQSLQTTSQLNYSFI